MASRGRFTPDEAMVDQLGRTKEGRMYVSWMLLRPLSFLPLDLSGLLLSLIVLSKIQNVIVWSRMHFLVSSHC